ncbi:hypothetical protein EYF80_043008 [Liparis tanakae]|uniref:Uncharacterized protein n=1 Tax=Liparis tanakae TaxID=230148 RepID=A0A4Z2FZX1_9TELE|nr:hypothetical protein EYF80_043008 [Liparis tanakae]
MTGSLRTGGPPRAGTPAKQPNEAEDRLHSVYTRSTLGLHSSPRLGRQTADREVAFSVNRVHLFDDFSPATQTPGGEDVPPRPRHRLLDAVSDAIDHQGATSHHYGLGVLLQVRTSLSQEPSKHSWSEVARRTDAREPASSIMQLPSVHQEAAA